MFLIDKSGSMEGAIEKSKEALSRILAGFPREQLHIAAFDTVGTVLKPKAANRAAVVSTCWPPSRRGAARCTRRGSARSTARVARSPRDAKLIVIVVGDEAGEDGEQLARAFRSTATSPRRWPSW